MTPLFRSRWRAFLVAAVVVLGLGGAMFTYQRFFREEPPPYFESDEDHFLFGSVGTEAAEGVPYWVWLVLPRIFPDLLPGAGGYAALGVLGKAGHEMPVGLSKVTIGFPRVGINCAMCHAASVRLRPEDPATIVAAAPSHQTAPQGYLQFLTDTAADPRFTADAILAEIAKNYRLSLIDRLVYRFAIIPQTRRALLRLREQNAWMRSRTAWGRGRIDPFNPVKFRMLGQPIDDTIGNSDMVPLWNFNTHRGYAYHWDGLNTELREVVMSSAIGDGTNVTWVDRDYARWNSTDKREMSSLRRVMNYISALEPPKYPLPLDQRLAAEGAAVFDRECAACHAPGQSRFGQVVPVAEVGTDRHRLDMWTKGSAAAYNAYGSGRDWVFSAFRTTEGYVAVSLDGLWLRGPYLHNGSVPSLAELLEPADRRPKQFWRGYDVIDPMKGGFVSDGPEARRIGTRYDTSQPGNSNAGHVYGTTLPADSKRALVEYLKTL
jgi:processive rubber oxygenase RoxA-like protein